MIPKILNHLWSNLAPSSYSYFFSLSDESCLIYTMFIPPFIYSFTHPSIFFNNIAVTSLEERAVKHVSFTVKVLSQAFLKRCTHVQTTNDYTEFFTIHCKVQLCQTWNLIVISDAWSKDNHLIHGFFPLRNKKEIMKLLWSSMPGFANSHLCK